VAVTTPRRRQKDPEGRMPLRAHLAELRRRLIRAGLALVICAVLGWFLADWVTEKMYQPIIDIAHQKGILASPNYSSPTSPFNIKLKLSMYIGLVISSPIWLYQLWAFIVPGLTKREKRYSMAFVAAAVPLFLAGIALAWRVLPNAMNFFSDLIPKGGSNIINAEEYISFVTRLMLAFGVAFVIPLVLVALNLAHVVRGLTLAKGWRIAVFLTFLFAAIASPTPDAGSMLALAFPMTGLYLAAVGIAVLVDRRRDRRAAADPLANLSDDEASPL
jgi:sec-independent protein translocase protein TatC